MDYCNLHMLPRSTYIRVCCLGRYFDEQVLFFFFLVSALCHYVDWKSKDCELRGRARVAKGFFRHYFTGPTNSLVSTPIDLAKSRIQ